jgi:nitrous oxidase accessory protein
VDNRTDHTRTGYALMQSKYLTVTGNRSEHDQNYGILMNYIVYSTIADNTIIGVRPGTSRILGGEAVLGAEGKAIFIYNSQFNEIHGNLFADSDIGIHLTAGSEDNKIYENAFIQNQTQVKYVATRSQEWSHDGKGNYWSDYLGYDMNGDGVGDLPYEPNDGVDRVLWKYPMAKVLMHSPAVETLHWVQRQFPVLRPLGVKDSHPLIAMPSIAKDLS